MADGVVLTVQRQAITLFSYFEELARRPQHCACLHACRAVLACMPCCAWPYPLLHLPAPTAAPAPTHCCTCLHSLPCWHAEVVDPRPYYVGELKATLDKYPHIGQVVPAMGYSAQQVRMCACVKGLCWVEGLWLGEGLVLGEGLGEGCT